MSDVSDTAGQANLTRYGWQEDTAAWWEARDQQAGEAAVPGRVGRVDRGECDVLTKDGSLRALSDSQRAQDLVAPATGDWVAVVDDEELGWLIAEIFPRRTAIVRRSAGERVEEQTLVANADVVGIVHGLDQPVNQARLERFLVLAYDSGAEAVVLLTKADLVDAAALADARRAVSAVTDAPALALGFGAVEGADELSALTEQLGRRTLVLLGVSGAGKSTLVNRLVGEEVQATADVRERDGRGRHTTVSRDLIVLEAGGVLIDTPGVRSVGVWDADIALERVYHEIAVLAADCRFSDCTHRSEPKCAVVAAVESGELDEARLERYHQLWEEITLQAREAEERSWRRGRS